MSNYGFVNDDDKQNNWFSQKGKDSARKILSTIPKNQIDTVGKFEEKGEKNTN